MFNKKRNIVMVKIAMISGEEEFTGTIKNGLHSYHANNIFVIQKCYSKDEEYYLKSLLESASSFKKIIHHLEPRTGIQDKILIEFQKFEIPPEKIILVFYPCFEEKEVEFGSYKNSKKVSCGYPGTSTMRHIYENFLLTGQLNVFPEKE